MRKIEYTTQFQRDFKRMKKKHYDMGKLTKVIDLLITDDQEELFRRYKDHALKGNWQGYRELHLEKDWLLIYFVDDEKLVMTLTRTGTHDEIL